MTHTARSVAEVLVSVTIGLIAFGLMYNIGVRTFAAVILAALLTWATDLVLWA